MQAFNDPALQEASTAKEKGYVGGNACTVRRQLLLTTNLRYNIQMKLLKCQRADAVVEAAILFPIMIMIFAALVMLAIYLPTRGALQHATQYAATALATPQGDTWLFFDEESMSYYWANNKNDLRSVYTTFFRGAGNIQEKAADIVTNIESRSITSKSGTLDVSAGTTNRLIYREVVVTATRTYTMPVKLSFIRFPETFAITVTSTAVVHNGDEFIRNVDIAADFVSFITDRYELTNITDTIKSFGERISSIMGW